MLRLAVVTALLLPALAGCLAPDADPSATEPLTDVVAGGPPHEPRQGSTAVVVIHESYDDGTVYELLEGFEITNTRQDRDAEIVYRGIHEIRDEWGRLIPTHVFQYEPYVLVADEIEIGPQGIDGTGHWATPPVEYYFDITDGRYMGALDVEINYRSFVDPDHRDPIAGFWSPMMFMAMHVLGGEPGQIEIDDYTFDFAPYDGERPLQGDCDMLEFTVLQDGREPDGKAYHDLLCMQPGQPVPLWMHHQDEETSSAFERNGPGFSLPPLDGEPLPPHEYPVYAWQEVDFPLPLDLPVDKFLAPPSSDDDDWAGRFQARAEMLYLSPAFLQYSLASEPLSLVDGIFGWPVLEYGILPILPTASITDQEAWIWTSPGEGFHWGFVETRAGPDGRDGEHLPGREGHTFGRESRTFTTPQQAPMIVATGDVVEHSSGLVPVYPRLAKMTNIIFEFQDGTEYAWFDWYAIDDCFTPDETRPLAGAFDATYGFMKHSSRGLSHETGCSNIGPRDKTGAGEVRMWQGDGFVLPVRYDRYGGITVADPIETAWPELAP